MYMVFNAEKCITNWEVVGVMLGTSRTETSESCVQVASWYDTRLQDRGRGEGAKQKEGKPVMNSLLH